MKIHLKGIVCEDLDSTCSGLHPVASFFDDRSTFGPNNKEFLDQLITINSLVKSIPYFQAVFLKITCSVRTFALSNCPVVI
jgi:hypothetical protein